MIDVGLIGFGLAGRYFHAPLIHAVPGLQLAAVVQRSGDTATKLGKRRAVRRIIEFPGEGAQTCP
jgi:predicted dehydrogenase